jgi:hypothetical protein
MRPDLDALQAVWPSPELTASKAKAAKVAAAKPAQPAA